MHNNVRAVRATTGRRVERRQISGSLLRLSQVLAAASVIASSASAQLASGEMQASDLAHPATPRSRAEITVAQVGRDLAFSFIQPARYNAVHIMWSGPTHPFVQEEYVIGYQDSQDVVRTYTIHHVMSGSFYMFKLQAVNQHFGLGEKDGVGPWLSRGLQAGPGLPPKPPPPPAPLPAPPPAPPAATRAPIAPANVSAIRVATADVYVNWSGDVVAEWYVVERRVGVAALVEAGSSPWVAASGKLRPPTVQFLTHDPLLPGTLKNIYRVIAYNNAGQAISAPVAESPASKISRRPPGYEMR